ncbi:MAG: PIN domain-containing protein [Bryobacterales bacterium]|nr:PIN domain-containing protein [Bryobacterales bacterium]
MSLVFWDTNLFVYLIEGNPEFLPRVVGIWQNMRRRGDQLCTSSLTMGEALVAPIKAGNLELANAYRSRFLSSRIRVLDFDKHASEHYARVRASTNVSRADAMQLACAAQAGVDLFLTNDKHLAKTNVSGIQFIASLESCPL